MIKLMNGYKGNFKDINYGFTSVAEEGIRH
jgi:hypothetical protein